MSDTEHKAATKPRRRRGRPPTAEHQRERIVEAAARLYALKGFETSSIADLAGEMGLSKAAIYHYFSTKQDIYDEIILKTLAGLRERVRPKVEAETDPGKRLQVFMIEHARFFEENYDGFIAMLVGFSGMAVDEFKKEAMRLRTEHELHLREIVSVGVREGAFREVDPVVTARAILSLLNWMARWFRPAAGRPAEEFAREYHDLIIRGIMPGPGPG